MALNWGGRILGNKQKWNRKGNDSTNKDRHGVGRKLEKTLAK